jgi:acyl carrier protein
VTEDSLSQGVAEIMGEILGLPSVAADDNFFEIGGNSFQALSLIEAARLRLGVEITMLDLVLSATPAEISQLIGERDRPSVT